MHHRSRHTPAPPCSSRSPVHECTMLQHSFLTRPHLATPLPQLPLPAACLHLQCRRRTVAARGQAAPRRRRNRHRHRRRRGCHRVWCCPTPREEADVQDVGARAGRQPARPWPRPQEATWAARWRAARAAVMEVASGWRRWLQQRSKFQICWGKLIFTKNSRILRLGDPGPAGVTRGTARSGTLHFVAGFTLHTVPAGFKPRTLVVTCA